MQRIKRYPRNRKKYEREEKGERVRMDAEWVKGVREGLNKQRESDKRERRNSKWMS